MGKLKLNENQKKDLLKTARLTIEKMISGKPGDAQPDLADPIFNEHYGLFVTITVEGNLRGCIGTFEPTQKNVASEIISNGISAATRVWRWPRRGA